MKCRVGVRHVNTETANPLILIEIPILNTGRISIYGYSMSQETAKKLVVDLQHALDTGAIIAPEPCLPPVTAKKKRRKFLGLL